MDLLLLYGHYYFLLTVSLAAAFVILVIGLLLALVYYRWRLRDSQRTLAHFIQENITLEKKREQLQSLLDKNDFNKEEK